MSGGLTTDFWLRAHIRRWNDRGISMMVRHKGDPQAGAVLVVINQGATGCTVLTQTRTLDGEKAWLRASGPDPIPETNAEETISRARRRDPDLWVVEIEDREGRHPFEEPIL